MERNSDTVPPTAFQTSRGHGAGGQREAGARRNRCRETGADRRLPVEEAAGVVQSHRHADADPCDATDATSGPTDAATDSANAAGDAFRLPTGQPFHSPGWSPNLEHF